MRKRLITDVKPAPSPRNDDWLKLDELATVELSSEDASHPIESALLPGPGAGWRAAKPGRQTIRLLFDQPLRVHRIRLGFVETSAPRTQEYVLRWSADGGQSYREIVRQQWNFSLGEAGTETEDHRVELSGVNVLELVITPDIGNRDAYASLAEFRVA